VYPAADVASYWRACVWAALCRLENEGRICHDVFSVCREQLTEHPFLALFTDQCGRAELERWFVSCIAVLFAELGGMTSITDVQRGLLPPPDADGMIAVGKHQFNRDEVLRAAQEKAQALGQQAECQLGRAETEDPASVSPVPKPDGLHFDDVNEDELPATVPGISALRWCVVPARVV
jgi:hypothetical protein